MTIPKHQYFRWPLICLVGDGEIYKLKDCITPISDVLKLSDDQRREKLPLSNRTRVYDRTYWAKKHLCVFGLLEDVLGGGFRISVIGKSVLKQNLNHIDDKYLEQFQGYLDFIRRSGKKK
jgi:restriction system protein